MTAACGVLTKMPKSRQRRNFFLTAMAATVLPGCSSSAVLAQSVTWTFAEFPRIAHHHTQVLGSPRALLVDGRHALCFDGRSDGVIVPTNPIAGWAQFTIEVLIKPESTGDEEQRFLHIEDVRSSRLLLETRLTRERQWALDTFMYVSSEENRTLLDRDKLHAADRWHWVALSFDGLTMAHHVNGTTELNAPIAFQPMTEGRISLGVRLNERSWYKGCIAEVRFTSRALSRSEMARAK
jgi:Concanavalin A-like lectin/glucanases superfamily